MNKLIYAAQLFTVSRQMQTVEGIEEGLKRIAKMGYTSVQISGIGKIDPQRLKDICDENNLSICVTHSPYDRLINDLDNLIKEHKIYGCSLMGLGAMPGEFAFSEDGYYKFAELANEIGSRLKDHGMKFAYHNHNFEFRRFNDKTGMDILIENTDPDCVEFILDTYWVQAGGCNPVDYIYKIKGRMNVCHFKDMNIDGFKQVFAEVGKGNLDFPQIIKACVDTGVRYAAVEQDDCYGTDPYECLETSLNYLNGLSII